MTSFQKKVAVNPIYISSLLGPLSLAVAMDSHGFIFDLVDYSDRSQCAVVIFYLVRPMFDRVDEATRQEIRGALGYLVENPDRSDLFEDMLLLCEVDPSSHNVFLDELWDSIFPLQSHAEYTVEKCKVRYRPLSGGVFTFSGPPNGSLHDNMNALHLALLEREGDTH